MRFFKTERIQERFRVDRKIRKSRDSETLFGIDVRQTTTCRCHLGEFPEEAEEKRREDTGGYSGLPEDPDNAPSTSLSMLAMSTAGARREDEGLRIRIGGGDRTTRRRKRRHQPRGRE